MTQILSTHNNEPDNSSAHTSLMTVDEAIRHLRSSPQYASLIRDAYMDDNVLVAAERFSTSVEFQATSKLLKGHLEGGAVLDLGAGNGIASYAFVRSGARKVYALEPDPSDEVGRGALQRLANPAIEPLDGLGETIPLKDSSVDIVYARQVLHHVSDLDQVLRECARVLKSGGVFLACREHVLYNKDELGAFLNEHPVHRLTGGENAFLLYEYLNAIRASRLQIRRTFGPWDTVINSSPNISTEDNLHQLPRVTLRNRFGPLGIYLSYLPGVRPLVLRRLERFSMPGRIYSFLAVKT